MSHARLSPSNHRWPECPGSVREEANYPDVAGAAAIDGTGSHLLLEMCMDNSVRAETYIGQIIGVNHIDSPMGWLVDDARATRVQMQLDYIVRRHTELSKKYPGADIRIESESKSDPGGMFGRDDWYGTADITITVILDGEVVFIEVCDYKDGRGWVSEKNNSQFISYVGGKLRLYIASGPDLVRPFKPEKVRDGVRMTVCQPKTNPVIRYQELSTEDFMERLIELKDAAHLTDDPNAPLVSGKHCRWCKASMKRGGHCSVAMSESIKTVKNMNTEIIQTDGGSLLDKMDSLLGNIAALSNEELSQLASAKDALLAAFDKVETEIETRIEQGQHVAGYAMRPGKSSRVWAVSEDEVVKALKGRRLKKDEIYPAKLISVSQMEKLTSLTDDQKKRLVKDFVAVKDGKMKLTKVAHGEESKELFKDVAQGQTDVVQSDAKDTHLMFAEVKAEPSPGVFAENDAAIAADEPEISFF